jgi:hypothetical protein
MTDNAAGTEVDVSQLDAGGREAYMRLRRFCLYMQDYGVQVWMLRVISQDVYGRDAGLTPTPKPQVKVSVSIPGFETDDEPEERPDSSRDNAAQVILTQAYNDAIESFDLGSVFAAFFGGGDDKPAFDLEKIAGGGASLALLVRYGKLLPREILPEDSIPDDDTVARILAIFHNLTRARLDDDETTFPAIEG